MYCVNCGKEIRDGNKFCPHCGAQVILNQPNHSQQESEQAQHSQQRSGQTQHSQQRSGQTQHSQQRSGQTQHSKQEYKASKKPVKKFSFREIPNMPRGGTIEIISLVCGGFGFAYGQFIVGNFPNFSLTVEIILTIVAFILAVWAIQKNGYTIIGTISLIVVILNVFFLILGAIRLARVRRFTRSLHNDLNLPY